MHLTASNKLTLTLFALAASLCVGCFRARNADDGTGGTGGSTSSSSTTGSGASSSGGAGGAGGAMVVQWTVQDSGTTADLRGVWIAAAGATAYAVGTAGTLLRSDDGGDSWQALDSTVSDDLNGVFGVAGEVYAVGANGVIVHSSDGTTFAEEQSGTGLDLRSVWASSASHVLVGGAGSLILRSTDGGTTWDPRPNAATTAISGIWGYDADHVYAVAEASLLTTLDGGDGWTFELLSITIHNDVWAASPDDLYIVNNGSVVTSWETDHWLKTILSPARELYSIWGAAADDIYLVGQGGLIRHKTDGGWDPEDSTVTESLRAVDGGGGTVLAVGDAGVVVTRP